LCGSRAARVDEPCTIQYNNFVSFPAPYPWEEIEKPCSSRLYFEVTDTATGALVRKDLVLDNHSKVMFDESLIPKELIRE